jgi:hypothetical protein
MKGKLPVIVIGALVFIVNHEDRNCMRLTIRLNRVPRCRHRDKGATETLWLWRDAPNDVTSHRRIAAFMDIC